MISVIKFSPEDEERPAGESVAREAVRQLRAEGMDEAAILRRCLGNVSREAAEWTPDLAEQETCFDSFRKHLVAELARTRPKGVAS